MKRKIILASHGKLAEGMLNSIQMIVGSKENIVAYELNVGDKPQLILQNIEKEIKENQFNDNEFIIVTDLVGGSVNTVLSKLCTYKKIYMISSMNVPLILELLLAPLDKPIVQVVNDAIETARKGILCINDYFSEQMMQKGGDFYDD